MSLVAPTATPFALESGDQALAAQVMAGLAQPVTGMQQRVNAMYEKMRERFIGIDDAAIQAMDLSHFLETCDPLAAKIALDYIQDRDEELKDTEKSLHGTYSARICTALKRIRDGYLSPAANQAVIQFTGSVRPADTMCLFVCGLLAYPSMAFSSWLASKDSEPYANRFFDYMIKNLDTTVHVHDIAPTAATAEFDKIDSETATVPASCFLCARENDARNMQPQHIVVLDAFSHTNQFRKYEPVVWHLYCLWLSRADDTMRCYAARTPTKSYIFIGCYDQHARVVTADANATQTNAVRELLVRPLELYRRGYAALALAAPPDAVVSRLWPNADALASSSHRALAYAHLLVQRACPLFFDTAFNTHLQDMIAFAVNRSHKDVKAGLPYARATPATPHPLTPPAPLANAYAELAKAHYLLMMSYKFVVPPDAKEAEILFDRVTPNARSQHRAYIGSLCHVRYSWVFDLKHAPFWNPPAELTPSAPYHDLAVCRHIQHLQSSFRNGPSRIFKELHTDEYVTDTADPARHGVIVFDVREHGHALGHFQGPDLLDAPLLSAVPAYADRHDFASTIDKFGGKRKTDDMSVRDAMLAYFKPPDKWSLSDMDFKYVVYDTNTKTYFMQDSFALTRDATRRADTSTIANCPFCPVCFQKQEQVLDAQHPTLYHHITSKHPLYGIPPLPTAPSETGASLASPRAQPTFQSELVPFEDSPSSESSNDPEQAFLDQEQHHETLADYHALLQNLKGQINKRDFPTASDTQAVVSFASRESGKKAYDELKAEFDKYKHDATEEARTSVDLIEQTFMKLLDQLKYHESELTKAQTDTSRLEQTMCELSAEHQRKLEENQERQRKDAEEHERKLQEMFDKEKHHLQTHEENKKLLDEIKRLEAEIADHVTAAADRDALRREIERLTQELAGLRAAEKTAQDALHDEIRRLREQLASARPEGEHEAGDLHTIADLRAQIIRLEAELKAARSNAQTQHETITRLQAQIAGMTQELQDALTQTGSDARRLKRTITANVQREIAASDLLTHMTAARPDYPAVARAVAAAPHGPKTVYTPQALFLILESMGGTWSLWLANQAQLKVLRATAPQTEATKKDIAKAKKQQDVLFQGVMYDLTMWNSITNDKPTRYTSHYVRDFMHAFGLQVTDIPSAAAEDSSDDDDPPPPETLTRAERAERAAAAKDTTDATVKTYKAELDAIFPDSD
jgi:hypothetical protein